MGIRIQERHMKYQGIVAIMLIIIIGVFPGIAVSPAGAAKMVMLESQITTESASQENPDIWGDRIVWQDNRNGNWDVYLYNDTTTAISRITTSTANQVKPKIYGDSIVFMDNRNNENWDIYRYNLVTQTETPVANGTASQQNPAIYGNYIVWQDNRNGEWDIYLYDLETRAETRITDSTQHPDSIYRNPAIYGNRIVWGETRITENSCCPEDQVPVSGLYRCLLETIYGRDLSSGLLYVTNDVQGQAHPAISGDRVVWAGTRYITRGMKINGKIVYETIPVPAVFMKNLTTNAVWSTSDTSEQQNPDISGNSIVWQEINANNHGWDIEIYCLDEQMKHSLVNNTANQQNPAMYGNSVVYQDYRNGNWDIYLTKFGYVASNSGTGDNQTPGPGSLYVVSNPSNASILINGADTGVKTNALVRNVPAGDQDLTLVKEGYQPCSMVVSVPEGGIRVLASLTLAKEAGPTPAATGTLYVASNPSNASILINGTGTG